MSNDINSNYPVIFHTKTSTKLSMNAFSLHTIPAYATLDSAQWKCTPVSPTAKELRNSQFFSVGSGIVAFPLHTVKGSVINDRSEANGLLMSGFFPLAQNLGTVILPDGKLLLTFPRHNDQPPVLPKLGTVTGGKSEYLCRGMVRLRIIKGIFLKLFHPEIIAFHICMVSCTEIPASDIPGIVFYYRHDLIFCGYPVTPRIIELPVRHKIIFVLKF